MTYVTLLCARACAPKSASDTGSGALRYACVIALTRGGDAQVQLRDKFKVYLARDVHVDLQNNTFTFRCPPASTARIGTWRRLARALPSQASRACTTTLGTHGGG